MNKIKDLTVKVTYTVGLSDVEVSDEVYAALQHLADRGEATSRQCNLMFKYDEQCRELDQMLDMIELCINSMPKRRNQNG